MRKTIILIAMLPLAAFAQNKSSKNKENLKAFKVHHEKDMVIYYDNVIVDNKKSKSTVTLPGPGDCQFGKDTGISLEQKANNAAKKPDWDKGYITAEKVTLICAAYPDLKADKLTYDQNTDKAKLTGHIRLVDKGTEKYIGEVAYLDFSDDSYKITGLK